MSFDERTLGMAVPVPLPRAYICDGNPRMRQLIAERLEGHADVVGDGGTAHDAVAAAGRLDPDIVVLDYRTVVGQLPEIVSALKQCTPSTAVIVHTGVPAGVIEQEVIAAGGVYASKNDPDHLVALVQSVNPAARILP